MAKRNPMQPIVMDGDTARFKHNAIVKYLLSWSSPKGMDLNELAKMEFTREDREQFAQLIGYSLGGYADLSYVGDASVAEADRAARNLKATRSKRK